MIPQRQNLLNVELKEAETKPSKTYQMNLERAQVNGIADGTAAVQQAVYKILNTQRYQFLIYSWNYGMELQDLAGQPTSYVTAELERRITEALTQDDRIVSVDAFSFAKDHQALLCQFTVHSIFGDIPIEQEVTL